MVTVFGILNLTEDSFFDESRRLDPAGAVTAAIEMLRVGSDVVDVGPAASHPDARPVSPADEIRRIAPLLDALSDQMHRVSIDSFQPETQRYALKRGVGYLNDIQGFPDPALYPDIAEADGTVAKLAMRQPFVLFKGLTFQKLCLPGAFRP
ncbi:dihydropteroate synthase, partial [Klebsiella pneumoniae]|uniref:dihydropteroate synthase n=1 Tax=Klebsiella pneumoniae TaxID=573 RepID=UPI00216A3B14